MLRICDALNRVIIRKRCVSCVRYCTYEQKRRFRRRQGNIPYRPNAGLRRTLDTLREEEGIRHFNELDVDTFDDEFDYDEEILHADDTYDQFCQEEEGKRKKIISNIIERKYFKPRSETNLLTVAAKEQLRYLHDTDPHTWTPEKLSNSFPVSVEGVKKLLKSNYHPTTEEEVRRHDLSVLNNWKRLKAGKGPIATAVRQQLPSGKLKFETLDGDETLPMPTNEWKQKCLAQTPNLTKADGNSTVGEFESMMKECRDLTLQQKANPRNGAQHSEVEDLQYELVPRVSVQNQKPVSFKEFKEQMKKKLLKSSDNHPQVYEKFNAWLSKNESSGIRPNQPAEQVKLDDCNMGFENIKDYFEGKIQKFSETPSLNVKWDVHRDVKNPEGKEAYIYEHGYQRPYGHYDENTRIEIPEELRRTNGIYRKGNCYYDEHGELLYCIP